MLTVKCNDVIVIIIVIITVDCVISYRIALTTKISPAYMSSAAPNTLIDDAMSNPNSQSPNSQYCFISEILRTIITKPITLPCS